MSLRRLVAAAATVVAAGAMLVTAPPSGAKDGGAVAIRFDPRSENGGAIPQHFVGLSIEWSLVERYMDPGARPAFVNLLKNLGTGVLRIGGSSQDQMPFDATAPNSDEVITPADLDEIRATLDAVNGAPATAPRWGAVLGTAMSPPTASRPFVSPAHAHAFVTQGVLPAFRGAVQDVAGVELGNEPDLSYHDDIDAYLADLQKYSGDDVSGPLPIVVPNTSEDILPWQSMADQSNPSRFFWDWPRILDTSAATARARAGAFGAYATDHFYPLARTCPGKPYRCPTIPALLSAEHMQSLDYQVYVHAQEAAAHQLAYRLEETNTAAGRGADGVSNVAASATYALDAMFHVACPQPPQSPGGNAACSVGAIGLNFHNAEVRAFFHPEEGNAYYNAIDYDTSPAIGAPTAAPLYYALLLFGHFAQGTDGLRPVATDSAGLSAWRVQADAAQRRLFLINKSDQPITTDVAAPASSVLVDRMTPYDPTGAGRTLDAPQVRIDGQQVGGDGSWPGFAPAAVPVHGGHLPLTIGPGAAVVVTLHETS